MRTVPTILTVVLLAAAGAFAAGPVSIVSGDRVTSRITTLTDVDGFSFAATAGGSFSATATALDGALAPALALLDPDGDPVDIAAFLTVAGGKASVKSAPLARNGVYRLVVSGGGATTGTFELSFSLKAAKGVKAKGRTLAPGATADFGFAAAEGASVKVSVKFRTPESPPSLVDLLDAVGGSRAGLLAVTEKDITGSFVATGEFGEWRLRLRNDAAAPAEFDVSISVKLLKAAKSTRSLVNASLTLLNDTFGTKAPIVYDVLDPEGRTVTVRFAYSLDGGANYLDCLAVGGGANPRTVAAATGLTFEWATREQLTLAKGRKVDAFGDVRVRVVVEDPEGDGDEYHAPAPPLKLWTYEEPETLGFRADLNADLLDNGALDSFTLLDSRHGYEYDDRHIPGAVAHGPPHGMALGDFDEDGTADIVTAEPGGISIAFRHGNGDGTFGAPSFPAPGQRPFALAVDDLDGDNHLDVVHLNRSDQRATILLGLGDGTFGPAARVTVAEDPRAVAIADLDGDSAPDLVVASGPYFETVNSAQVLRPGYLAVLLGNGDGTFGAAAKVDGGKSPTSLAVALLNADAHPDLVVCNDPLFESPVSHPADVRVLLGAGDGTFAAPVSLASGGSQRCAAAGDFDGDAVLDLAVATELWVYVYLGNGDGSFAAPFSPSTGANPMSLAVADVDGEGTQDLVVADGSYSGVWGPIGPTVSVLRGPVDGTFRATVWTALGHEPSLLAVGAVGGDAKPDVVVGVAGPDNALVFLGAGGGALTPVLPDKDRRVIFYCYGIG